MITFTTTATFRPDLIEQTYSSFSKKLTGIKLKDCELIINVDPIPKDNLIAASEIIKIAQNYFGTVTHNFPETANFPSALKWAWSNTKTNYVFNLEDDWILLREVDLNYLISMLTHNTNSMGVSLNAYLFNNDPFRIRLSPGLFRGSWVREAANYLDPTNCPERQLRSKLPKNLKLPMLNFPQYSVAKLGKVIVSDTGRKWREKRSLVKNNHNSNSGFITWKKK
jgi:hypothetical protein